MGAMRTRRLAPACRAAICATVGMLLGIWGCFAGRSTAPGASLLAPAAVQPSQSAATAVPEGFSPAVLAGIPPRYGVIAVTVRWPVRDLPGFRAALLPASTNALYVSVRKDAVTVARTLVKRSPGLATATASVEVPAGKGYSVAAFAYREADPDFATAKPIAQGFAANVDVEASRAVSAKVRLDALFAPFVSGVSPGVGIPGDTVTLSGGNFDSPVSPLAVTFNGATASIVGSSSGSITCLVPASASVGPLVVRADGISSTGTAAFWVVKSLDLGAPKASWDGSGPASRKAAFGTTLQFVASPSFAVSPGDSLATFGQPPAVPVTWTTTDSSAGSIDAAGKFSASQAAAMTRISASFGTLSSPGITVTTIGVTGFRLSPAVATLGAGTPSVQFVAENALTDGSTNSFATFSSSDSGVAAIDASGRAAGGAAATGSAIITATSGLDPTRSATASVVLVEGQTLGSFTALQTQLPAGRYAPAVRIMGPYLWVFGGGTSAVVRARILDNGDLAPFENVASLSVPTGADSYMHSAIKGGRLYLVSGGGIALAALSGDDIVSNFQTVAGVSLKKAYLNPGGAFFYGNFLYVPGTDATDWAAVDGNGNLADFQSNFAVNVPSYCTAQRIGSRLYTFSGTKVGYNTIQADGTPSAPSTISGVQLATFRHYPGSVILGGRLYVIGGGDWYSSIEQAPILDNDALGPFNSYASASLRVARGAFGLARNSSFVYVVGGAPSPNGLTVERAPIE